jgi:hypothetical protein
MPAERCILQIDGGGIRGIAPALVLADLERRLDACGALPSHRLRDRCALITGTSTGAILGGMVAAGVPADAIAGFYADGGPALFAGARRRLRSLFGMVGPLYDRRPFLAALREVLRTASPYRREDVVLGDLAADGVGLMVTAVNLCSQRTHFIKSGEPADQGRRLDAAIAWSALSAAHFFGAIPVPDYAWQQRAADPDAADALRRGAVFQDGGQGTQNCTVAFCMAEIAARGWDLAGPVRIVSLGCGATTAETTYAEAARTSTLGQIGAYFGQARQESTAMQIGAARHVAARRPGYAITRLDYEAAEDVEIDDISPAALRMYRDGAARILASQAYAGLVEALAAPSPPQAAR